MEFGTTLQVRIQDKLHVRRAVMEMSNPNSRFRIRREQAAPDDCRGNYAVEDFLADAVADCQIPDVHISFMYCNLSSASVRLLANAIARNQDMGAITISNYDLDLHRLDPNEYYDPRADQCMPNALARTRAPINYWNGRLVPPHLIAARHRRNGAPPPRQAAISPPPPRMPTPPSPAPVVVVAAVPAPAPQPPSPQLVLAHARAKECMSAIADVSRTMDQLTTRLQLLHHQLEENMSIIQAHTGGGGGAAAAANQCGICFDRSKNRSLFCGHRFCSQCVDAVRHSGAAVCPECRAPIAGVIPSF